MHLLRQGLVLSPLLIVRPHLPSAWCPGSCNPTPIRKILATSPLTAPRWHGGASEISFRRFRCPKGSWRLDRSRHRPVRSFRQGRRLSGHGCEWFQLARGHAGRRVEVPRHGGAVLRAPTSSSRCGREARCNPEQVRPRRRRAAGDNDVNSRRSTPT